MVLNGQTLHPKLVNKILNRVHDLFDNDTIAAEAVATALPRLTERQQDILLHMNELEIELAQELEAFLAAAE